MRAALFKNNKDKIPCNKLVSLDNMDRVRRISSDILQRFPDKFTTDFSENKKTVQELATIRSKVLRNKIAGYITSYLHRISEKEVPISEEDLQLAEGRE
ncbi:MAG: 30S ribosomal protein S17e [Nitrososphaeraceae archaeon]